MSSHVGKGDGVRRTSNGYGSLIKKSLLKRRDGEQWRRQRNKKKINS